MTEQVTSQRLDTAGADLLTLAGVNDANVNYFAFELPMGGWKDSGLGVRHGAAGIRKYTRQQAILVTRFAPSREIHYFPYNARVTKLITRGMKLFWGR